MTDLSDTRPISRQDTNFLLRYALGIAIEIAVAVWLLSVARGDYAWSAWIAYLILASAAVATFVGLSWCWLRFGLRGLGWYLAALVSVMGAWLLISERTWSLNAPIDWVRHLF